MRPALILFLILTFNWASCSYCNRIRCSPEGAYLEFRLLRDGKNVIFGQDAFIHPDSLNFTICKDECYKSNFRYFDSSDFLRLTILHNYLNLLEIPGVRTDTFTCETRIAFVGECCAAFDVLEVRRNGIIICTGMCNGIIDLEI